MERTGRHDEAPKGRVVILGGSGFLGRGLARWLGRRGGEVVAVSRSRPGGGACRRG